MPEIPEAVRQEQLYSVPAWIVVLFCFTILCSVNVGAVGFRLPNQDPVAIARGNAFVATADNPSAIYYNPAGITQMNERNLRAGVYFVSGNTNYTPDLGRRAETNGDFQPVPQLYFVHPLQKGPLVLGIGLYSPYGLAIDWGKDTTFSTIAQEGEIRYISLNPVIAWEVNPEVSVGFGVTVNYSDTHLIQGIGLVENDRFKVEGDGFDIGFNAGFLWRPSNKVSFGLNYRSETTIKYEGNASTAPPAPSPPYFSRTRTSAEVVFPQFVVAGISLRPTKDWNFELNVDWTDWDSVDEIAFRGLSLPPLRLNYKSSFMYEFGVTRRIDENFDASLGFFFSENSSPDANFNPIIPDSDLLLGSIGLNYRGKNFDWAAAYHFGYNGGRRVKGSANNSVIGETADGRYETLNHAFNFAVTYKY